MEIHNTDFLGNPATLKTDDPDSAAFCALCLRERPPGGEFYEYSSANAFQFRDTLKRTIDLDLNLEEFDICTPCWKLLQLVEDFRLCCVRAASWAEQKAVGLKPDNSEEWFSSRVVQTIDSVRAAIQDQISAIDRWGVTGTDDGIVSEMSVDEIKMEAEMVIEDVELPEDDDVNEFSDETEEADETSIASAIGGDLAVFRCNICGICFDTEKGLQFHMRRCWISEKPPVKLHPCSVCGASMQKNSLAAHMNRHAGVEKKIYSKETLKLVVEKVRNGELTQYRAAKEYGIPRGTLQFRLSEKYKQNESTGPKNTLNAEEEKQLVAWIIQMQRRGFIVTSAGLQAKVAFMIKLSPRPNKFKNGIPGTHWMKKFFVRHPEVVLSAASTPASEVDLRGWFSRVSSYAISEGLTEALQDPRRKLVGAELDFLINGTGQNRFVTMLKGGDSRRNMTVLFSFSADGDVFPPDTILPNERIPGPVAQSFPGDWKLGKSNNGKLDEENFVKYIKKFLHPALVQKGVTFPVIYFVDGHRSSAALVASETCQRLGIVLIALYPDNIIQPAEAGCFSSLMQSWNNILNEMPQNEFVTISTFASTLKLVMDRGLNPELVKYSFKTCGLEPFDPNALNYENCPAHSESEPTQPCDDIWTPADVLHESD